MNYVDPLGLCASDKVESGRGAVVEFYDGDISVNYRDGTVARPEFGDVVPDSATVTIHDQSYGEFRHGEYQVQITEPGTYSIPDQISNIKPIAELNKKQATVQSAAGILEMAAGVTIFGAGVYFKEPNFVRLGAYVFADGGYRVAKSINRERATTIIVDLILPQGAYGPAGGW